MSLFNYMLSDLPTDPIFGSEMQSIQYMNNLMDSMFHNPYGFMGRPPITNPQRQRQKDLELMFGFPMTPTMFMGQMHPNFNNMAQNPHCHSFSSSSFMSMVNTPDGRPQVYQESMSTTMAPGGIKETKKTVSDSRTGTRKMAIGHHIGERAHILEREHNVRNGEQEERQELINLDEEEAESFNGEWEARTRCALNPTIDYLGSDFPSLNSYKNQLALPGPSSQQTSCSKMPSSRKMSRPTYSPNSRNWTTAKRSGESWTADAKLLATSTVAKPPTSTVAEPSTSTVTRPSTSTITKPSTSTMTKPPTGVRKRERTPDSLTINKRQFTSYSDHF